MFRIKKLQSPLYLTAIVNEIDSEFFRPVLPNTWTQDMYYGAYDGKQLIALGFLRGWDAGWDDICLGVAVLPKYRQQGVAGRMCTWLEFKARDRKVERIRLHVHPDNVPALKLYEKLGYEKTGTRENGELIMYKELKCE